MAASIKTLRNADQILRQELAAASAESSRLKEQVRKASAGPGDAAKNRDGSPCPGSGIRFVPA